MQNWNRLESFRERSYAYPYAKSKVNENGKNLIEFYSLHNLRITNTFSKHKTIQKTYWHSPAPYKTIIDAEKKKLQINPYRNQIDYAITRNNINARFSFLH